MAIDLVARLKVHDDNFSRQMSAATNATRKLQAAAGLTSSAVDRMSKATGTAGGAFSRMSSAAGSALSGVKSHISNVTSSVVSLGAAVGVAAAGMAAFNMGKSAIKLSSDAEQASIAFTTMLGSGEKAAAFLDSLKKFANDTPFQLDSLRDSSRQLLAFGFDSEKVIPMLTNMGDAAAGLGLGADGIKRMSLAMGQINSKGKLQGDELMQLNELGVPALQILADKMKITTGEVSKLSEKGLIPASGAIKAILEGMDKKFHGLTDKQSKSLGGLSSTIKDTFDNDILKRFGDGVSKGVKPAFEKLVDWIDTHGDTIIEWGNKIERMARDASEAILGGFQKAYNYINTNYLSNPKFQNLSASGKVSFIINDLGAEFNKWLAGEGGKQVKDATESLTAVIGAGLDAGAGSLVPIASKLGVAVGDGLWDGFQKTIADHPILSAALGGYAGARFGLPGIVVGAGVGAFTSVAAQQGVQQKQLQKSFANPNSLINRLREGQPAVTSPTSSGSDGLTVDLNSALKPWNGSHAGGLDRVPYNGYIAELHQGERVQTKAEADQYRSGRQGGVNVTVNMNGVTVRQDSDIDAIARSLAQQVWSARSAATP